MAGLLKPSDVAARWSCSGEHVRNLCRTGQLRGMRLGVEWRISEADLLAYEAAQANAPAQTGTTVKVTVMAGRARVNPDGEYEAVCPGVVPWRSTVIEASPASGSGRTARTKRAGSVRS